MNLMRNIFMQQNQSRKLCDLNQIVNGIGMVHDRIWRKIYTEFLVNEQMLFRVLCWKSCQNRLIWQTKYKQRG